MAGGNLDRMRDMCQFIRTLSIPRFLLGDFKNAPEVPGESGWFELIRSRPGVPDNVEFTCDAGETMIGYPECPQDFARE
eukprot:812194-Pyramimonas_sp.AAC.1